jgi:hypothetical protein
MLVNFGVRDLHIMPLRTYEFQAQEVILGTSPATDVQLLSINRAQSMVVTGHRTENNTLRRYPYVMGLCNNPTCRKCGTEEETSVHILYKCETSATLRHAILSSFFLDPENTMNLSKGAI